MKEYNGNNHDAFRGILGSSSFLFHTSYHYNNKASQKCHTLFFIIITNKLLIFDYNISDGYFKK